MQQHCLRKLHTLPPSAALQALWTESHYAMHSKYDYGMLNEQAVSSQGFLWLLAAVLCVSQACLQQCSRVRAVLEEGLKAGRTPRTQWGLLLQDMQEAGQAVSEVAHGRWAKLLGSRSAEYPHCCQAAFCCILCLLIGRHAYLDVQQALSSILAVDRQW